VGTLIIARVMLICAACCRSPLHSVRMLHGLSNQRSLEGEALRAQLPCAHTQRGATCFTGGCIFQSASRQQAKLTPLQSGAGTSGRKQKAPGLKLQPRFEGTCQNSLSRSALAEGFGQAGKLSLLHLRESRLGRKLSLSRHFLQALLRVLRRQSWQFLHLPSGELPSSPVRVKQP